MRTRGEEPTLLTPQSQTSGSGAVRKYTLGCTPRPPPSCLWGCLQQPQQTNTAPVATWEFPGRRLLACPWERGYHGREGIEGTVRGLLGAQHVQGAQVGSWLSAGGRETQTGCKRPRMPDGESGLGFPSKRAPPGVFEQGGDRRKAECTKSTPAAGRVGGGLSEGRDLLTEAAVVQDQSVKGQDESRWGAGSRVDS